MTRLIDRRRLVFEAPFLTGKRPLVVRVEAWGLRLREKGRRDGGLPITWAQVWNRAALITAEARAQIRKADSRMKPRFRKEKISERQ